MVEINGIKYDHCGLCERCLQNDKTLPCSAMIKAEEATYYEERDRRIEKERAKEDWENFLEGFSRGEGF